MQVRKVKGKVGWAFGLGVAIAKPPLLACSSRTWINGTVIPPEGGCIVALNHLSYLDPLMSAHFVYDHGRVPRYLAKSGLFKNPILGGYLRSAGQIPVHRLSSEAVGAYDAAVAALQQGECVVVYPEGTLTRDPDLWPMRGKSGAARLALATGAPVIPVGHWGAQEMLAPYAKKLNLRPRKHVAFKAGDPVPLADLMPAPGAKPTGAQIREATERIMAAITALVGELRGEVPPAERFDPKKAGVSEIGNPENSDRPAPDSTDTPQ